MVTEKLAALRGLWDELESTTRTKARRLFDANRAELCAQSCAALRGWLAGVRAQLRSDDYGKDLTSVNILLNKQQVGAGRRGGGKRGNGARGDGGREIAAGTRGAGFWAHGVGRTRGRGSGRGAQTWAAERRGAKLMGRPGALPLTPCRCWRSRRPCGRRRWRRSGRRRRPSAARTPARPRCRGRCAPWRSSSWGCGSRSASAAASCWPPRRSTSSTATWRTRS